MSELSLQGHMRLGQGCLQTQETHSFSRVGICSPPFSDSGDVVAEVMKLDSENSECRRFPCSLPLQCRCPLFSSPGIGFLGELLRRNGRDFLIEAPHLRSEARGSIFEALYGVIIMQAELG